MKKFHFHNIHIRPEGMFGTGPDGVEYLIDHLKNQGKVTTVKYKAKNNRWVTVIHNESSGTFDPSTFMVAK